MTTNIEQRDQTLWDLLALAAASGGFEADLFSRRGLFIVEGCLLYYDNTPSPTRDELIEELREWLEECGLEEMACTSFPESGANQGHTFAMAIAADNCITDEELEITDEELESTVRGRFQEIIRDFNSRLPYEDLD